MTNGMDTVEAVWWEQMYGLLGTHELPTKGNTWEMSTRDE